ncbi:MAG TPA: PA14 domain-containing protein [Abditibacteriaceae bacterium]|jgi:hypothetical protein
MFSFPSLSRCFFYLLPSLLLASPLRAQTPVLQDEFNSGALNSSLWSVYGTNSFLQRTQFGLQPQFATESGTSYMRLRLDSYTPDSTYRGNYFKGTEIHSRSAFTMGPGMEFETRVRGRNLPRGIVFAFFTYGERGTWPSTYFKEEIDYEFLTNMNRNQMWLNIWDNWNPQRGGPNQGTTTSANFDWSNWNTYKVRWLNDRVVWLVNDVVVRTSTDILPDDPMEVRFNIWAPSSGWGMAYDATLKPSSTSSGNNSYFMDVDYVRVNKIAPPANAVVGTGDGVKATYFDNANFTGSSVSRVVSRVNFPWGTLSPDAAIGADTFSARWEGWVQPQYSQTYTFYARADDGVRLWVNNQLLIDAWKDQGATEYSKTITLTAGQKYSLKMEYYENAGGAAAHLLWSSPSTPKQVVPQSQLYSQNVVPDTAAPTVTIATPVTNYSYRTMPGASGTAGDTGGSNLAGVSGYLRRLSDNLYWTGSAWSATSTELAASGTTNWNYSFPTLPDGRYSFEAIARDGAGNIGRTTPVPFYIDTIAPVINIFYPLQNGTYTEITDANGRATDAVGIARVSGRLYRYADGTYWNGTGWTASEVETTATGTPPGGATWSFNFPALTDGKYHYQAIARDYVGNTRWSAPVVFNKQASQITARTIAPTSVLSTATASTAKQSVTLVLLTPLDAASAQNIRNYSLTVNGVSAEIVKATWSASGNSVTLGLAAGALRSGDSVTITWAGLRDAKLQPLPSGSATLKAN